MGEVRWPSVMIKDDPELRQMDIGNDFATKEELLKHLDSLDFCNGNNSVVVDGDRIVRG